MRAGHRIMEDIARRILTEVHKEMLGRNPLGSYVSLQIKRWDRSGELEEIKTLLLAHDDRQREERRREWLARGM